MFKLQSGIFQNNLINIDRQKAINIATNKENELTENRISEISVELGIRKMNNYIYLLENNIDN